MKNRPSIKKITQNILKKNPSLKPFTNHAFIKNRTNKTPTAVWKNVHEPMKEQACRRSKVSATMILFIFRIKRAEIKCESPAAIPCAFTMRSREAK